MVASIRPKNSNNNSSGNISNDITVTFALESIQRGGTAKETWINKQSYTVPRGSKVFHVFDKALREHNIQYDNPSGNYVKYILSPTDGQWFGEFSNGQNSGWMYKVNGVFSNVGLAQYELSDRDDVLWLYTNDYKNEPGNPFGGGSGGSGGGGGSTTTPQQTAPKQPQVTPVSTTVEPVQFTDVPQDKWYSKAVVVMVEKGLVKGREDNKFEPNAKITRAEFITILSRIEGKAMDTQANVQFKDIKSTDWYYQAIAWANANNIAKGTGGTFNPNQPITREEMAAMLMNYIKYNEQIKIAVKNEAKTFADNSQVSDWAKESVQVMQSAGIIGGNENNQFAPKTHATRAETMEMLYRLLGE